MKSLAILCSSLTKKTATKLANAIGGVSVFNQDFHILDLNKYVYLNWGSHQTSGFIYNSLATRALNKIETEKYLALQEISRLKTYVGIDKNKVQELLRDGLWVVARKLVTSSRGKGIVLMKNEEDYIKAPMYTLYYPKTHEFRVFVGYNYNTPIYDILDYVQKKKKVGIEYDGVVWNKKNGYVYCHNKIVTRSKIKELAIQAADALGLDYCAVDILARMRFDEKTKRYVFLEEPRVCEINSAPGLENTVTFQAFVKYFNDIKSNIESLSEEP